jgi:CheY-like chemotaxis protein/phage anti-repressor protein
MIPCCFHPTRVVIVDDRHQLLNSLDIDLPKSHMTFDSFHSPQDALHYINEVYHPDPFPSRYTANVKNTQEKRCLSFDIYAEIYRPQRFEEISAVVADYSLQNMTGLKFFEKIKHPDIQKILLVGEGQEGIAREALNGGSIQAYISKEDPNWCAQLYAVLQNAQWQYFSKLSETFMNSIESAHKTSHALVDSNFQKFFKTILTDYGFTEAYLCETTGSYLFLDRQAQDHGLVVNIGEQLDTWVRTGQSKGINLPLLKALKDRKKMMCYHTRYGALEPDKRHWEIYAHTANKLKGQRNLFYYAFAPNMYDIDLDRILPFKEYRENQQRKVNKLH